MLNAPRTWRLYAPVPFSRPSSLLRNLNGYIRIDSTLRSAAGRDVTAGGLLF